MGQPKRKEKSDVMPSNLQEVSSGEKPNAPNASSWAPPALQSRLGMGLLAALVLLVNLPLLHSFLWRGQIAATARLPYHDDFSNPKTVAENYWSSGGLWRTVNGELLSPGVKNNPLWLKAQLPAEVAVEFDVRSMSPEGDIKVEIFGDGTDHASGYVLIHGGWNNALSIIARMDEHAPALGVLMGEAQKQGSTDMVKAGVYTKDTRVRVEANPYRVEVGKSYHWRIERRGSRLNWLIDGREFLSFDDPFPLSGKGHDRFAFSSWESQLYFDNLSIEPL